MSGSRPLTGKQRLTRLFEGRPIDRIPIWLLYPFHPLPCYAEVHRLDCYRAVLEASDRYADIFDRRVFDTGFCLSASAQICLREEKRGGRLHRTVCSGSLELRQESVLSEGQPQPVKHWVEEPGDLERILALPYQPPRPDTARFFTERDELKERGLMMADIGDPLQVLYNLMSVENFAVWTLTDRAILIRFLDEMHRRYLELYRWLLDRGVGPVYFIVGAEFAGPPVVSPTDFMDLSARYVKGIVDLIRERGRYSILHYHGNLARVLEGIRYINPDGLHTIEAPPVGDCTISRAREALGDMILIGNIQYDEFRSLTPEQMEARVQQVVQEGKSGRFILSPTAGPYERHISPRMQQNYIRFMETGAEYGAL